ncbi:phage antirepressor KilAC domain-containing protein [uncultured Faecalibaculum sp.]|uniref:phage antirepressor KilAC domain-containing protein n=1 Tax=uncultured Faecalibaculum sp. TaxID=1729681 RepID=UPI0025E97730|nr:phage antirepressor KilAC domain-containing protein [uncultured Faecalibaculum sp.]
MEVTEFKFDCSSIRVIVINGEPHFVGKDVAGILGYQNGSRDINRHTDTEDRDKVMLSDGRQLKETIVINESGLYSLILSSKLPTAKRFKRWVTSEVLPAIRKTGLYAVDQLLDDPDLAIRAFTQLKEERERRKALELTNQVQAQQIAELQPKASYYDVVLNCKDLLSIGKIAKDFGKSAVWMNRFLHEKGVQYKQGDIWLLYAKHQDKGYTSTKTQPYAGRDGEIHSRVHTYWTQKGRLFIYDLLKDEGILPVMERKTA